ncbi:MAG TPA: hypothetical protein VIS72_10465 [Anaerolineales bacterium]
MSRLKVSVAMRRTSTPPAVGIFETRGYGDPIIMELMGLDTNLTGPNFNHIDLYSPTGGWGAVHKFQKLDRQAMDYLKSIQPNDMAEWGFTINQKMNWLVGHSDGTVPDRPYWTKGDSWNRNWTSFVFGIMVFGHQLVKVETNASGKPREWVFNTTFPNSPKKRDVVFYKPVGMKRSEIGKFTHETHPWFIQKATAANHNPKPNSIDYAPRGVMYHPVWDLSDWQTNFGSDLYLAKDFLI